MRELHRLYQQFLHAAREAVADSDCDLAQHVSLGNAQSGFESLLRARGRKVAGPVGGGQIAPWALLPQFGARAVTEVVRSVLWAPMPGRAARVGRTVRPVDLAYGTNPETCATLRRLGAPKVQLMLADGIRPEMLRDAPRPLPVGTPPQLLWMGRLTARKGVWLLLDAAAALRDRLPEFRLFIAGRGPLRDPMAKRIAELGLGTHVTMLGQVPHAELPARLDGTDVHLFTSLRDSSGMQCLEAWARGVPTVHLALHGIGHFAPQAGGVPVSPYPVRTLAERYADAIASTVRDREQLAARSAAALAFAHTETWPAKARRTLADLGLE
jgi:glycosyltransferase involved in cell wall biosynthesis